ncbi:MAG: aminotransferase class V-fold PLP-dependent enzyme [Bacillota bacterium]|jgi:cysteine desulfurase/selenocysteine lyase
MIYLDNAATTWPKPPAVLKALSDSLREFGANPGRGGHSLSLRSARMVFAARQQLASFFGSKQPHRWVYTSGATESANAALFGLLNPGDHVLISQYEHNAVARPLYQLSRQGVEVTRTPLVKSGKLDVPSLTRSLRPTTRLLAISHASNVTGTVLPIDEICDFCRANDILLLVDASQTAGLLDIDVSRGIDLLLLPGHKSLYGPPGIGALYASPAVELRPYRFGGTGSQSESLEQPQVWPDRMESGTLNTPGIYALQAGINFVQQVGKEAIYRHEMQLARQLVAGLREIDGIQVYGWTGEVQVPVVACNLQGVDGTEVALILDQSYGIAVRSGLHCAPVAHKALGTLEQGVVRFSIGYYNTHDEILLTIEAMQEIAKELR